MASEKWETNHGLWKMGNEKLGVINNDRIRPRWLHKNILENRRVNSYIKKKKYIVDKQINNVSNHFWRGGCKTYTKIFINLITEFVGSICLYQNICSNFKDIFVLNFVVSWLGNCFRNLTLRKIIITNYCIHFNCK